LTTAGIVLCGGQSRRMGRPKETLPFGSETMLARVVRLLGEAVDPVIVVAGQGQELPALPSSITVVHDRQANRGPLEGLAVGLQTIENRAAAAFATACDVPLLMPEFVVRMFDLSAGHQIAVPHIEGYYHPLSAVYRTNVLPQIEALLTADRLRPKFLFEMVPTRRVTADELSGVDLRLQSLANVNGPEDYAAALQRAGLAS